jgi:hypothetical protein
MGWAFGKNQIKQLKLPQNIEIIKDYSFKNNQIKILDLSNCIKLKAIEFKSFEYNQIKQLKLPKNIKMIKDRAFEVNNIESLDLLQCTTLNYITYLAFSNNPLQEIKILDNIDAKTLYSTEFKTDKWNNFTKYYNKNNKKAGDYKLENNEWKWYPL